MPQPIEKRVTQLADLSGLPRDAVRAAVPDALLAKTTSGDLTRVSRRLGMFPVRTADQLAITLVMAATERRKKNP